MVYTAGKPVQLFKEVKGIRLLSMPANTLGDKYFIRAEITKDDYTWLEKPVPVYASGSVLAASVEHLTKADQIIFGSAILRLIANVERLKRIGHPKWTEVKVEDRFGANTSPLAAEILKCYHYDEFEGFKCK